MLIGLALDVSLSKLSVFCLAISAKGTGKQETCTSTFKEWTLVLGTKANSAEPFNQRISVCFFVLTGAAIQKTIK